MLNIEYKIEKVKPKVFAVIIKEQYDRAMTFLRIQEFYECPNPLFRGNIHFSFTEYMKWYSKEYGKGFTYGIDWSGFNVPLEIAYACYDTLRDRYTDYDDVMESIVHQIYELNGDDCDGYIIGAGSTEGDTFQHEICHGLYATNKQYKELVDEVTETIEWQDYLKFEANLLDMGYTAAVIPDEIQAYLSFGHDYKPFTKGVSKKVCNELHKQYINVFNNF
jgi:hypothetical protein